MDYTTIKTFTDACKVKGIDPATVTPYAEPKTEREESINALAMLDVISDVLNDGWIPNWNDANELKWFPWFRWNGAGFGFSPADCAWALTYSDVGSRLCFKSEAMADYAGKTFEALYNKLLTKTKPTV